MRKAQEQTEHDGIVKARVQQMYPEYQLINADIPGYTQPAIIGGYRPDIIAKKKNVLSQKGMVISEIETANSYNIDHTREQLKAFRKISGAALEVIIPESVLAAAKRTIVSQWGIEVDRWMTF